MNEYIVCCFTREVGTHTRDRCVDDEVCIACEFLRTQKAVEDANKLTFASQILH